MAREERVILLKTDIDNSSAVRANAELTKSIALLKKEQKDLKSKTNGLTTATEKQSDAYVKNDAKIKSLQEDSRKYTKILKDQTKEQKANQRIVTKTNGSINSLRNALNINRDAYRSLTKFERENTSAGKQLLTTIKQQDAQYKQLSKTIGNSQANVGNYGATLKRVAGQLGIFVGAASAIRLIKSSINTVKDFELGVAKLASVLGTTPDKINALTDDAKRLGESTIFAASQVSQLQTEFAKLGFNEDQILSATEATLNLAAATGAELSEAAAIAGATLGGFGLDASETGRVTDVMAKSFSGSALDLEKFKESMKTAAPAARAVGVTVEETTALLGTLANSGINGSKAGTALKKTFIELNAKGLTMNEAFSQVTNSSDKLGTAVDLVGKLAAPAFLVLSEGTKDTEGLTEALNNADGAAKTMAETQQNTLSGALKALSSKWEAYILNLNDATNGGNLLTRGIKSLGNNLSTIINTIAGAVAAFLTYKAVILSVNAIQKVATGVTTVYRLAVIALNGGFTKAIRGIKAFKIAMAGTGIGLLVLGVGALISALSSATDETDDNTSATNRNREAQEKLNSELEEGAKLRAGAQSITDRITTIGTLTNEQRKQLKSDIQLEIDLNSKKNASIKSGVIERNRGLDSAREEALGLLQKDARFAGKTEAQLLRVRNSSNANLQVFIALTKEKNKLQAEDGALEFGISEEETLKNQVKLNKQLKEVTASIKPPKETVNSKSTNSSKIADDIAKKDLDIAREGIAFKLSLIKDAGEKELKINANKYNVLREDALANEKLTNEQKTNLKNLYDQKEIEASRLINVKITEDKIKEQEKYFESVDKQFTDLQSLRGTDQENEIAELVLSYEEKYLLAEGNNELEAALAIEQAEKIAAIEKKYTDKSIEEERKKQRIKETIEQQKLELASSSLGAIKGLLNEESAAYKAFAVAQVGIDTYIAAQKAYSSQLIVGDPTSPIRGAIAAGIAVAGGLANLAKIQGFAEGSESTGSLGFADYTNHTGMITGQGNISPLANGDNMLATIKTGEAILNNKQQGRLNNLLGFDAIKYAVKGYADGTTFTGASQTGAINNNVINNSNINNNSQSQDNITYIVDVKDVARGLDDLNLKVKDATI